MQHLPQESKPLCKHELVLIVLREPVPAPKRPCEKVVFTALDHTGNKDGLYNSVKEKSALLSQIVLMFRSQVAPFWRSQCIEMNVKTRASGHSSFLSPASTSFSNLT